MNVVSDVASPLSFSCQKLPRKRLNFFTFPMGPKVKVL